MASEKKLISIIALVFAVAGTVVAILTLFLSWLKTNSWVALTVIVVGLIVAFLALLMNRRRKQLMAIIAMGVMIVSVLPLGIGQHLYAKQQTQRADKLAREYDEYVRSAARSYASEKSSEKDKDPKVITASGNEKITCNNVEYSVTNVRYTTNLNDKYADEKLKSNEQAIVIDVKVTNNSKNKIKVQTYDFDLEIDGAYNSNRSSDRKIYSVGDISSDNLELKPKATATAHVLFKADKDKTYTLIHNNSDFKRDFEIDLPKGTNFTPKSRY